MFMPALGNIKTDGIVDIYNSKSAAMMRKTIRENACPHCWMNCYSVHSIMQHPVKSVTAGARTIFARKKAESKDRIFQGS